MALPTKLSSIVSDDTVRQLLGISAQELPDGKVDTPLYFSTIKTALRRIDQRTWSTYGQILDTPLEGRSEKQSRVVDATEAYIGWRTAYLISTVLPMLGVKSLTDGKAGFTRDSGSAGLARENLAAEMNAAEAELIEALRDLLAETAPPMDTGTFLGTFTPSAFNPITG